MKKITILLAGVLVSTFAFAFEPGPGSTSTGSTLVKKNESTFKLYYQGTEKASVRVSIFNASGTEVFSETIHKTLGFIRPYNLESMGEGEYTIVTDNGTTKKSQKFNFERAAEVKAANIVKLASNKYLLAVKGQYVSGKINVRIYDGSTLVHKQQSDVHGDFGQLFTLKNASNAINFEVTDSEGKKIN